MYKTLFFLSSILAELTGPIIDCNSGTIAPEDVLTGLTGAPQTSQQCIDNCGVSCVDVTTCNNDNVADCSFDLNAFENNIGSTAVDESCGAALAGKWTLTAPDQGWSTMTKVTVTFGGLTGTLAEKINLGSDCNTAPTTTNQADCTDNVCDITTFVTTVMTDNILVAMDTAASPIDLSPATVTASITATSGHVYAAAPTCTDIKTSQSDCENAGCKWCYDSTQTGCGVSPSVCQNDGTSSTTSTASTASTSTTTTTTSAGSDSLLSVGFAAMIGAFIFKFM